MNFSIECEREEDGRWIAEIPELPGALAYGNTPEEAMARSEILALRALAEQLESGEVGPKAISISIPA
jgi:predicted RNase H-like HicB family nuclease